MDNQEDIGYIKLIGLVQPTTDERISPDYTPKLQINPEAMTVISDQFKSPISILVYVGREGVGKSKLASITVASLRTKKYGKPLSSFRSDNNVKNVTDGIWMWRSPLKDPNENNKGSILLLDCEGISHFDENRSSNLYLFSMVISTAFAVILRPPRADHGQCNLLYDALRCFDRMRTPSVLPSVWLVPLDLAELKNDDRIISPDEWIEKVFSLNESNNTLATTQNQQLKLKYDYIRTKLPIRVVNIIRLPAALENDNQKIDDIFTSLREKPSEDYYKSLGNGINQFLKTGGKRIPGSSSTSIFIRPAELAQFMSDLIGVINTTNTPNPDELIGQYLLTRFNDTIATKMMGEFKQKLLLYADRYAKGNLQKEETDSEKEETDQNLYGEHNRLVQEYIAKIRQLAEERIYGRNSILLTFDLFRNKLDQVRDEMNRYEDPKLLIEGIRIINKRKNQNTEEIIQRMSQETQKKLKRFEELILGEERINESIDPTTKKELRVELERCPKCFRAAGPTNVIHAKEDCNNPSRRNGNYYRYNGETDQMVCDACRKLERIPTIQVKCTVCGTKRRIIQGY